MENAARSVMAEANTVRSTCSDAAIGFIKTENASDSAECALTASTPMARIAHARGDSPHNWRVGCLARPWCTAGQ